MLESVIHTDHLPGITWVHNLSNSNCVYQPKLQSTSKIMVKKLPYNKLVELKRKLMS